MNKYAQVYFTEFSKSAGSLLDQEGAAADMAQIKQRAVEAVPTPAPSAIPKPTPLSTPKPSTMSIENDKNEQANPQTGKAPEYMQ